MHSRDRPFRYALPLGFASALVIAGAGSAHGQDLWGQPLIKPGEETFELRLGGILNQFDTKLRVDGQSQRGTSFELENDGLKDSLSSFEAAGTWRFAARHRLDLDYFTAKRSGSRSFSQTIDIGDNDFPLGATVNTDAKQRFLLADYRYSFLKSDAAELAVAVGFYGGKFEFELNAVGNGGLNTRSASVSSSTSVPLPVIGLTLDWYATPAWKIGAGVQGMKASIGDVDGHIWVAGANAEYMLLRNLGVGLRYMYSNIDVDVTKNNFHGNIDWSLNSVSLYAKLAF